MMEKAKDLKGITKRMLKTRVHERNKQFSLPF